uniref:Uncharacterized protein n=1 Tax=Arundo donax TaxID=35708 RepID=A0A0A9BFQ8_ARUDO
MNFVYTKDLIEYSRWVLTHFHSKRGSDNEVDQIKELEGAGPFMRLENLNGKRGNLIYLLTHGIKLALKGVC